MAAELDSKALDAACVAGGLCDNDYCDSVPHKEIVGDCCRNIYGNAIRAYLAALPAPAVPSVRAVNLAINAYDDAKSRTAYNLRYSFSPAQVEADKRNEEKARAALLALFATAPAGREGDAKDAARWRQLLQCAGSAREVMMGWTVTRWEINATGRWTGLQEYVDSLLDAALPAPRPREEGTNG